MANNSKTPLGAAGNIADLLFAVFVFVADADEGLTAREVQRLHEIIEETGWCHDQLLKRGLDCLRLSYGDLWKDYQTKLLKRDIETIAEKLNVAGSPSGCTSRAELAAALRLFLERFSNSGSPVLVRLGLAATAPAKQRARREVEALLAQYVGLAGGANVRETAPATSRVEPESQPEMPAAPVAPPIGPSATLDYSQENVWKRGRTTVRCMAVIPETHDVRTFVFQAIKPVLFAYKPGQFITLELQIDGRMIRRSYTISSSPSRPHALSITVKRVPGGLVSNWLHDNMREGVELDLSGPNGEFTCLNAHSRKLLLVAGGSGITPLMSMLRWSADTMSCADIVFINNIRTPADIIFERELSYLGSRMGAKLKLGVVPSAIKPGQTWNGPVSRFSEHLLRLWAPDCAEREAFVCGPPAHMSFVRTTLEQIGFPMQRYHEESFGAPPAQRPTVPGVQAAQTDVAAAPAAVVPEAVTKAQVESPAPAVEPEKVEIVFSKSGKTLSATTEHFILDLAEENGLKLENSCRAGNCGTCKVKKIEGEVDMEGQQALGEADLLDGYVLLCIGRAGSRRVVLDV
jgi:glycine betaine catabolism B